MKSNLLFYLVLALCGGLSGCSTDDQHRAANSASYDSELTKQVSNLLKECQQIKPGMTRADLLKVFTTEGGLWSPGHRTYVLRRCPQIKVDVEFVPTQPDQTGEKPTDIISKISKPYLDWSVID